jgi:hypothetical protein
VEHELYTLPEHPRLLVELRNSELFQEICYILAKKYTTLLLSLVIYKDEFEDTKRPIIIRTSKKNRQHNTHIA